MDSGPHCASTTGPRQYPSRRARGERATSQSPADRTSTPKHPSNILDISARTGSRDCPSAVTRPDERHDGCGGATARTLGSAGHRSTPSCEISSDACGGRTACGARTGLPPSSRTSAGASRRARSRSTVRSTSAARPRRHLRCALPQAAPRPRGARPSLAAQSSVGKRDLRAPGGDPPSRLSRSRTGLQRTTRRAHPARVRPLLPWPAVSQPAHPAARRRALARAGTSSHLR